MKTSRYALSLASALVLFTTVLTPTVSANFSAFNGNDHSSRYLYTLNAGEQVSDKLTVVNLDNQAITVNMYGADATTTLQGDFAAKTIDQTQLNVGKWIKLENPTVTLQPYEQKEIGFSIQVPDKTPPGAYAGGIAIATVANPESTGGAMGMISVSRVIIKTVINIPGEKVHSFQWDDFSHQDINNNHTFNLAFKNTGNTSVIADGYIEVLGDPDGNSTPSTEVMSTQEMKVPSSNAKPVDPNIAANILKFNNINLFQSDEIKFTQSWLKKPLYGNYKAVAHVTFWEFDVTTGEKINPQSFTKEVEFSVLPWGYIMIFIYSVLGIIVIVASYFLYYGSLRKNSQTYTVQANDTLSKLATANNVNWKKLAKINKIKAPYSLQEGQKILLPLKKK